MELGQKICGPSSAKCELCPLSSMCLALVRGTQLQRPVRPIRSKKPHYQVTAGVICRDDGHFLIAQRPSGGLLGGLWEFPGGKQEKGETLEAALKREIREELAIEIEVKERLITVEHAYTHFSITLHAYRAWLVSGNPQNLEAAAHAWVLMVDLDDYPFSRADRKIIEHLSSLAADLDTEICGRC